MNAGNKKGRPRTHLFYDFVKITAALPGVVAFRPKYLYENEAAKKRIRGGALLIANHFGFFDPVYLQFAVWYRRMRQVCLQQFFDSRAGWLFRAVHCIPVDRDNIGMDSIREIVTSLKNGEVVGMYPEGHINTENEDIQTFKSGMVLMALQSGCPVIAIYMKPRKHWYERLVFAIGEPVDPHTVCGDRKGIAAIEQMTSVLKEKEESLKKLASEGKT